MPLQNLEACFFVDEPPAIEFRGGLFHITQIVGAYRFERVMQPSIFLKTVAIGVAAARKYRTKKQNVFAITPKRKEDGAHAANPAK